MEPLDPRQIHIKDFTYDLPDERVAKYPLDERDTSQLLVYKNGKITDSHFQSIADYLPADSLMVYNNTKVIQARMFFQKSTGAQIEIFCLDPYLPHDYNLIFQSTDKCSWHCMIGNLKKWKDGELTKQVVVNGKILNITAVRKFSGGNIHIVEFSWDNSLFTFADILDICGELPIPPYLNRETEDRDKSTYQTVYSKIKGSVAAPTAGLHFTDRVFENFRKLGIETDEVTLHVGAGTFKPVKSEVINDHEMHSEFISVRKDTIEHILAHSGNIIAVGTTSVRTLESLYYIGAGLEINPHPEHLKVDQWQPYDSSQNLITKEKALKNILDYLSRNSLKVLLADTQIIIAPGYEFKIVTGMVTNFHQPQSTLLLLVSAFVKGNWRTIYNHALVRDYRFLSYGDSSLLLR